MPLANAPLPCRYLVVLGDRMKKVIFNFQHFQEEHATDFDTIKAAYAVASTAALQCQPNSPFIIAPAQPPQLKRDRYQVETKPVGYRATCTSEQVSASLCGLGDHGIAAIPCLPACW